MKFKLVFTTAALIGISFFSVHTQELDEKLGLLEPFTRKNWEGKEPRFGEDAKIEITWNVMKKGKVIKKISKLEVINSTSEAYYYWDFSSQEIGVFSIHNNGNFLHGHVKEEGGKIIEYGYVTLPDKKLEFRNIFEFTEDGNFLDK